MEAKITEEPDNESSGNGTSVHQENAARDSDSAVIEQVKTVYEKARAAFPSWQMLSVSQRLTLVRQLRLVITKQRDEVAKVISEATGKPVIESISTEMVVVLEAIRYLEAHAVRALRTRKTKTPMLLFGKKSYLEFKPRGTVLVISPWNVPFQLSVIPVLEALAAGNTVILKPSEVTPAVGDLIAKLFTDAGFPNDVFQVVQGDGRIGEALVDAKPDFIHFTGSVRTGRRIQTAAAEKLIPTTLELGGKDPMIIFADANLKRAVHGASWGALCNSGQICMSVERVYVERSVYDPFVKMLAAELLSLRQKTGEGDDVGRMTVPNQVRIVKDQVAQSLTHGAQLLYGEPPDQWPEGELSIKPMLLLNATQSADIMQEETFGPVLPVVPFDTEEQAIQLANDTRFGLSCSVWTGDRDRARRVVRQLMVGGATINDVIMAVANPHLPYGGVKEGGIGRYHADEGLKSFSVQTSVVMDSGKKEREVNWFPYAGKTPYFSELVANWYGERRNVVGFLRAFLQLLRISKRSS